MWVFRRGAPDREVLIYQYDESRGSRVPRDFLVDYRGYVQTDGYKGYDFLDSRTEIRHIGCWAHARRKFMDVIKARGKKAKTGSADVAVNYIRKLKFPVFKLARAEILTNQEHNSYPSQVFSTIFV
jgi:transposase